MSSQRFCLRWNNHQTNMLSVFDQLLHAETFTDVTLAIEGQYLKAHKMVLSACSPYFQQIFVNHPEKHPIVILKDVPFKDMKCLLDFMYRGEVSVDQDRLAAFLRVAESLRIKGLTEVSDDKPPLPTASLTSSGVSVNSQNVPASVTPTQQQLQQQLAAAASRNTQLAALHQQKQKSNGGQSMLLTNPLLGSALSQQKRKRGRPRKLSGSDTGDGEYDGYESDTLGSPELMEVKLAADGMSNSGDENVISRSATGGEDHDEHDPEDSMDTSGSPPAVAMNNNNSSINKNASSNSPAPSGAASTAATASTNTTTTTNSTSNAKSSASSLRNENSMSALADKPEITIIPQFSKSTASAPIAAPSPPTAVIIPMDTGNNSNRDEAVGDVVDEDEEDEEDSDSDLEFILPKFEPPSEDCSIVELPHDLQQQDKQQSTHQMQPNTKQHQMFLHQLQQQHLQNLHQAKMRMIQGGHRNGENGDNNGGMGIAIGSDPEDQDLGSPETPGRTPSQDSFDGSSAAKQPARRRARRKNLSPDDQAEALTEMSVRGLNLFRYARITDGVYQCMECAKENVQKTFKNKYSFQRHAFLYHEGAQRKVFPCPVCSKEFSRPDKMKNHLKTTHESYTPKVDATVGGYPMNFVIGIGADQPPPMPQPATKIESAVLSAIQLQQHINMQKELHSQQAKFHQLISPNKDSQATTIVVGTHNGSQ